MIGPFIQSRRRFRLIVQAAELLTEISPDEVAEGVLPLALAIVRARKTRDRIAAVAAFEDFTKRKQENAECP
ncbi:hypothetical protein D3C83_241110 [compost metagenome]